MYGALADEIRMSYSVASNIQCMMLYVIIHQKVSRISGEKIYCNSWK